MKLTATMHAGNLDRSGTITWYLDPEQTAEDRAFGMGMLLIILSSVYVWDLDVDGHSYTPDQFDDLREDLLELISHWPPGEETVANEW